jgi:hypothetical protein
MQKRMNEKLVDALQSCLNFALKSGGMSMVVFNMPARTAQYDDGNMTDYKSKRVLTVEQSDVGKISDTSVPGGHRFGPVGGCALGAGMPLWFFLLRYLCQHPLRWRSSLSFFSL